jgi:hypothetical protein
MTMLCLSVDRDRTAAPASRRGWLVAASGLAFWLCNAMPSFSQAQASSVLCHRGDGVFDAESRTSIKVHVGAARQGELATRACAARLNWEKQELVVATAVSQLDLDVFGVDMDGIPVAAFQIKDSDSDCCAEYKIYSLKKPPQLLRAITGGDFFSASDLDLDGSVEIWTHDAAVVNGFDKLALGELDYPPTVVFRLANGQLQDVSAEFQSYFDDQISRIRAGIVPQDLEDFKASDGELAEAPSPSSAERLHRLRVAKIKVLEIVWAYFYSGREQDAWRSLGEMWPPLDIDRIRAALVSVRARGVHSQADSTSAGPPSGKKKQARIFNAVSRPGSGRTLSVTPPRAILLTLPPGSGIRQPTVPESELLLDLVVDAAGKVRSAEPAGKLKWVDPDQMNLAMTWKFIPAFKDGRPVASRLRIAVSPRQ